MAESYKGSIDDIHENYQPTIMSEDTKEQIQPPEGLTEEQKIEIQNLGRIFGPLLLQASRGELDIHAFSQHLAQSLHPAVLPNEVKNKFIDDTENLVWGTSFGPVYDANDTIHEGRKILEQRRLTHEAERNGNTPHATKVTDTNSDPSDKEIPLAAD